MKRTPTYNFAKYVYGEQSKQPLTKGAIENRKWFLCLTDEQLVDFFNSCHNEWLPVLRKYLDILCEWYCNLPLGTDLESIKTKLQELYDKAIKLEPRLTADVMDSVTSDEFPNWAARVYISTMAKDFDPIQIGQLVVCFSGILYLKKLKDLVPTKN